MQQDKTPNPTFFQWNKFGPSAGLMASLGSVRVIVTPNPVCLDSGIQGVHSKGNVHQDAPISLMSNYETYTISLHWVQWNGVNFIVGAMCLCSNCWQSCLVLLSHHDIGLISCTSFFENVRQRYVNLGDIFTGAPVASFTKEVNLRLAKHPLKTNGRLANRGLTSLVKEATVAKLNHAGDI